MRRPQTQEELRSVLGLFGYMSRFVPDMATKTYNLRILMASKGKFVWTQEHENDYRELKNIIENASALAYFSPKRRTRLIVDASNVGLGGTLVQFEDNTDEKPLIVSNAHKSLTQTERNYSPTEKEALACVWGVEKFKEFLLGRKFELETDHQALISTFNPRKTPPGRVERWAMRLQIYDFKIIHKPGKSNVADPISRMAEPEPNPQNFDDHDDKIYLNAVLESVAVDIYEIADEIKNDPELQLVKEAILNDSWYQPEIKEGAKAYVPYKESLSVYGDHIVRDCRLVIPKSLRERLMALAHEGHPGETQMTKRLRLRVWWPMMDKEAKEIVKKCEGCQLTQRSMPPEPMNRRMMPLEPWVDVALDFLSVVSGLYLLVVVDYFSRFMEAKFMKRITANLTVKELERIFTNLGYPYTITLDNGRQLVGTDMESYCKERKITLKHSTPQWPQENGEVERQNSSLLKRLRISYNLGRDMEQDLLEYLMMYNSVPHTVTGKTPTQLLYGRNIRTKIPEFRDIERMYDTPNEEYHDKDTASKYFSKEREDMVRGAKPSSLQVGDTVRMKNLQRQNKLDSLFSKEKFVVTNKVGSRTTVRSETTNREYDRNSSHLLKIPASTPSNENPSNPRETSIPEAVASPDETFVIPQSPNNTKHFFQSVPVTSTPAPPATEPSRSPDRATTRPTRIKMLPSKLKGFVMDSKPSAR